MALLPEGVSCDSSLHVPAEARSSPYDTGREANLHRQEGRAERARDDMGSLDCMVRSIVETFGPTVRRAGPYHGAVRLLDAAFQVIVYGRPIYLLGLYRGGWGCKLEGLTTASLKYLAIT